MNFVLGVFFSVSRMKFVCMDLFYRAQCITQQADKSPCERGGLPKLDPVSHNHGVDSWSLHYVTVLQPHSFLNLVCIIFSFRSSPFFLFALLSLIQAKIWQNHPRAKFVQWKSGCIIINQYLYLLPLIACDLCFSNTTLKHCEKKCLSAS